MKKVGDEYKIKNGSLTLAQQWNLDSSGNAQGYRLDFDGDSKWDLLQKRAHNRSNEIRSIRRVTPDAPAASEGEAMKQRQSVQCFIFSWPRVKDLAVELYRQLEQVVDTLVINSGDNLPGVENCLNIGEDAYFTEQMNEMLTYMQACKAKAIAYTFVADTKLVSGNYADLIDTVVRNHERIGWGMYGLEREGVRMFRRDATNQHMAGVHEIPKVYPADLGHCFMHRKLRASGATHEVSVPPV